MATSSTASSGSGSGVPPVTPGMGRRFLSVTSNYLTRVGGYVEAGAKKVPRVIGAVATGLATYAVLSLFSGEAPKESAQPTPGSRKPVVSASDRVKNQPSSKMESHLFDGKIGDWNVVYDEKNDEHVMYLERWGNKYKVIDRTSKTPIEWNSSENTDLSGDKLEVVAAEGENGELILVKAGQLDAKEIYDEATARYNHIRSQIRKIKREEHRKKTNGLRWDFECEPMPEVTSVHDTEPSSLSDL